MNGKTIQAAFAAVAVIGCSFCAGRIYQMNLTWNRSMDAAETQKPLANVFSDVLIAARNSELPAEDLRAIAQNIRSTSDAADRQHWSTFYMARKIRNDNDNVLPMSFEDRLKRDELASVVRNSMAGRNDQKSASDGLSQVAAALEEAARDPSPDYVVKINGTPKYDRRVSDMEVGETGWTVPWALHPVEKKLQPSHTIHMSPHGTAQMRVVKTADGYEVFVPDDYR